MKCGMLITTIMDDSQDVRKQVEGEYMLRRTYRDVVQVGRGRTTRRVGVRRRADAAGRRRRAHPTRWNSQVWWESGRRSMLGRSRKHELSTADEVLKRDPGSWNAVQCERRSFSGRSGDCGWP